MKDAGTIVLAVFAVVGVIVVTAGIGLLMAFPVKWCWNATMPYLFEWPMLTWGKAWCLYFLAGCLIKSTSSSSSN